MENQAFTARKAQGARIKQARKRAGLTQAELGAIFGITRESVSQWESGDNSPTADKLGRIAIETHVTTEWLMSGRGEMEGHQAPPVNSPFEAEARKGDPTIPVVGLGAGGTDGHFEWNGEEVDRLPRPTYLTGVAAAYAIYLEGKSMFPRYDDGELLFVHPGRPIVPGCDVVVQFYLDDAGGVPKVWVKQFVERGPKETTFKQFNPAKSLTVATNRIIAVHRIVGTGER